MGRLQQRGWTAEGPLRMAAPARSQLEIGPVQQDPSQRPDLRVDEEPRRRPGRTPGTIDALLEEAHRTLLLPPPKPDAIHDQRSPFSCSGALPAPSPRTLVQALTEVTIVVASPAAMRTSLAVVVDAP